MCAYVIETSEPIVRVLKHLSVRSGCVFASVEVASRLCCAVCLWQAASSHAEVALAGMCILMLTGVGSRFEEVSCVGV